MARETLIGQEAVTWLLRNWSTTTHFHVGLPYQTMCEVKGGYSGKCQTCSEGRIENGYKKTPQPMPLVAISFPWFSSWILTFIAFCHISGQREIH
jgi:hypothetical protein